MGRLFTPATAAAASPVPRAPAPRTVLGRGQACSVLSSRGLISHLPSRLLVAVPAAGFPRVMKRPCCALTPAPAGKAQASSCRQLLCAVTGTLVLVFHGPAPPSPDAMPRHPPRLPAPLTLSPRAERLSVGPAHLPSPGVPCAPSSGLQSLSPPDSLSLPRGQAGPCVSKAPDLTVCPDPLCFGRALGADFTGRRRPDGGGVGPSARSCRHLRGHREEGCWLHRVGPTRVQEVGQPLNPPRPRDGGCGSV